VLTLTEVDLTSPLTLIDSGNKRMIYNQEASVARDEVYWKREFSDFNLANSVTHQDKRAPTASLLVIGVSSEDQVAVSDIFHSDHYRIVFCEPPTLKDAHPLYNNSFDACILELNRPVEACFELLATIKTKWPLAEVIILSRLADEDLWIESIQRGAYDFLAKPLDQKELRRIVMNAVEKNRPKHC
jgi:response regulator RpfG family c-di-GMP phosphodiesterase